MSLTQTRMETGMTNRDCCVPSQTLETHETLLLVKWFCETTAVPLHFETCSILPRQCEMFRDGFYNARTNVDSSVCRDQVLPISLFTVSTQQFSYLVYLFNPNGENILLHKARVEWIFETRNVFTYGQRISSSVDAGGFPTFSVFDIWTLATSLYS